MGVGILRVGVGFLGLAGFHDEKALKEAIEIEATKGKTVCCCLELQTKKENIQ